MTLRNSDLARIKWSSASVCRLDDAKLRFDLRKDLGWSPPFVPFSSEERTDPREVLPTARSVITIAVPYWHPYPQKKSETSSVVGRVSRSSWGMDYHEVVREAMEHIIRKNVSEEAVHSAYIQSDTGPLEERAWALYTNLGHLGTNSCIFVPPYGSWVFLGISLVEEELPKNSVDDDDKSSGCNDCGLCLDACPTGALFAPYRVNGHRCLSYITQRKGFLPESLARKLDDRLYGCDTCQNSCPANKDVSQGVSAFKPTDLDGSVDLNQILKMDEFTFREVWEDKSSAWRGRRTLQRNALIIYGNNGSPHDIDNLIAHVEDLRPVIRAMALWAIRRICQRHGTLPGDNIIRLCDNLSNTDPEHHVKFQARKILDIC